MKKVKLNILGLSYSQTQTGAYALVLSEADGNRRIPIIIGAVEAQAIAIQLEGLKPPRPLTHDLFLNVALAFDIECPIFTTEEIIEKAGIIMEFDENGEAGDDAEDSEMIRKKSASRIDYSDLSPEELSEMLEAAISEEDYEKASEIRDEIKKRKP